MDGEVRAFHNICRHRGNKLVWNDFPSEEVNGTCRQFTCKYHGWRYDLDGALNFVQQEGEFFDLDKDDFGLVPVNCDVWEGFIFVNLAKEPEQSLTEFLGPMVTSLEGYPFDQMTERWLYRSEVKANWKLYMDAFQEFYHAPVLHAKQSPSKFSQRGTGGGLRGAALPDRRSAPPREHRRHPGVGARSGHAQAHRGDHPQRAVRAVGRARPRHREARPPA